MTDSTQPPAGWYPAPHANGEMRYWDGTTWLETPPPDTPAVTPEKPKKRGLRWWGWTLIGVGAVIVLIVAVSVANGGGSSPETTPAAANSGAAPASSAPPAPAAADGSREHPYPLGTVIHGQDYDVKINSFTPDATQAVLQANQFNQQPPAGQTYAVINATITYTGSDKGLAAEVMFAFVDDKGNVYDATTSGKIIVAPDPALGTQELYKGASVTGNEAIAIPAGATGLIRVIPGMVANDVFVSPK